MDLQVLINTTLASRRQPSNSIKIWKLHKTTMENSGFYRVKEAGLEYQHVKAEVPTPKNGKEFLERFR